MTTETLSARAAAHAGVADLSAELERLATEVRHAFGALSPAQLNWQPGAAEWSVGQCCDHLVIANSSYLPLMEQVAAGAYSPTFWQRIPLLPRLWGPLLIRTLSPGARPIPAPRIWEPTSSAVDASIIERFTALQAELVRLMRATGGHDPGRVIITSPAAAGVTYSLLDAYRIIVVHEQTHIAQARRVTEAAGFPAA